MADRVEKYMELCNDHRRRYRELVGRHPGWNADRDARLIVFNRTALIFHTASLFRFFQVGTLTEQDFWRTNFGADLPDEGMELIQMQCSAFINTGLLQFQFSSYETALRLFVRGIDPAACGGAAIEFKRIYDWLFQRLNLQHLTTLFDLLRMLRNTIHNNGIYISRNATDASVTYKGKQYDFVHRHRIDFVTWDLIVELYEDVADALVQIVEAPELAAVGFIEDLNARF
jgi:hypothetical protein